MEQSRGGVGGYSIWAGGSVAVTCLETIQKIPVTDVIKALLLGLELLFVKLRQLLVLLLPLLVLRWHVTDLKMEEDNHMGQ